MRTFAALVLALAFVASSARADDERKDPKGTQQIRLKVGERRKMPSLMPASRASCDDPSIVKPDMSEEEGVTLEGLKAGSTLCNVHSPDLSPQGLYRVTVVTPAPKDNDKSQP